MFSFFVSEKGIKGKQTWRKGQHFHGAEITIYKKGSPETVLLSGKISNLINADELNIADKLETGQKQDLIARFHFPENARNEYKGASIEFKMSAIAVQTKNNPSKDFK